MYLPHEKTTVEKVREILEYIVCALGLPLFWVLLELLSMTE